MRLKLSSVEMDTSIQCRASIDTATVSEYAERMTEGDAFPPVVVYGTAKKCWIADGWHRIMAANQLGLLDILADIRPGGRIDALKAALAANAAHGIRRTNQDKRRAVEIALREFPKLSSRIIAEMCGVSNHMVDRERGDVGQDPTSTRIDTLGRNQPATRRTSVTFAPPEPEEEAEDDEEDEDKAKDEEPQGDESAEEADAIADKDQAHVAPKSKGVALDYAAQAIAAMQRIPPKDGLRRDAWQMVRAWLTANE